MTCVLGIFVVLTMGCGTIDANRFFGLETCDILNCDGLFFRNLADDHDDMAGMDDADAHGDEGDDHMVGADDHDDDGDDNQMDDMEGHDDDDHMDDMGEHNDDDDHAEEDEHDDATEGDDGSEPSVARS